MTRTPNDLDIQILGRNDAGTINPAAWDSLADVSRLPNPFYERWSLLPALKHLEAGKRVHLVTVYQNGRLVCLFPVRLHNLLGAFNALTIWRFPNCEATDVLSEPGVSFAVVLRDVMTRLRSPIALSSKHRPPGFDIASLFSCCQIRRTRKAVTRVATWEDYEAGQLGKQRRENRRVMRRALEREWMRYVTSNGDLLSIWYQRYLGIEHQSWKSLAGTTLAANVGIRNYFEEAIQFGKREKIEFQALLKGEQAVAMSFRFKAQRNAYEIKTSYSNKYRKLYPGVVLELLNVRELLGGRFVVADSCSSGNRVVQRIWPDEILIYRTVVFDHSPIGKIAKFIYSRYRLLKRSPCGTSAP